MRHKTIKWVFFIPFILILLHTSFVLGFPAKQVYERTSGAVVLIVAKCGGRFNSVGAGSVISNEGLVITNAHVVMDKKSSKKCTNIGIYLKPEKVTGRFEQDLVRGYDAKILDYSEDLDLAVLKIVDPPGNLEKIEIADSDEIKVGEEVIAIGHPEQGGLWSLTYGRISGEITNYLNIPGKDVFQTDTSLNRGNSGGPLLDARGYIVGVNSNIARIGPDNMPITGVNFAIQSNVVKNWLNKTGYKVAYGKKSLIEIEPPPVPKVVPEEEEKETGAPKEEPREETLEKKPEVPERESKEETLEKKLEVPKEEPKKEELEKKAEPPKQEKKEEDRKEEREKSKKAEAEEKKTPHDEEFQTPKRPYDYDELLKAAERELEDLMDEMRKKIRGK